MQATLLSTGLLCVIAAIIGGGIKLLGGEIPVLASRRRRFALFAFGLILLASAAAANPHGAVRRALCAQSEQDRKWHELGSLATNPIPNNSEQLAAAIERDHAEHAAEVKASQDTFCPIEE